MRPAVARGAAAWLIVGLLAAPGVGCDGLSQAPAAGPARQDGGRPTPTDAAAPQDVTVAELGAPVPGTDAAPPEPDPDLGPAADLGSPSDCAPDLGSPAHADLGVDLGPQPAVDLGPEPALDLGPPPTDLALPTDLGPAVDPDLGPDPGSPCAAGGPGCTCVVVPEDPAATCWHSYGGQYGEGGCSAAYQCCDGAWRRGTDVCGLCTCREASGERGCVPPAQGTTECFPAFRGSAGPLPEALRQRMTGVSWRPGCPVGLDELALLELDHWDFAGQGRRGQLVVAAAHAPALLQVFGRLWEARFPFERIELIEEYGGDDDLSMGDNNSSAFNCRPMTGGGGFSQHAYGTALDLDPVQNPYVHGGVVLPPAGAAYLDREAQQPGMIVDPGPVTGAFRSIGWQWGGDWASPTDYQHFSANGR